jgi:serine O-acetyltransferase
MQTIEPQVWTDPAPHRPVPFWESVRQDVIAHVSPAQRGQSWWWRAGTTALVALGSSGFRVTLVYRLAHTLRHRTGPLGRVLAAPLYWWNRHFYGCSIAPIARLYGGLILPHPQGIVVGHEVVIGPRCWIFQNASLGGAPGKVGMPRVGADARIYAGAVLSGPIAVGDNVTIGANAVVSRDVPDRTMVRCPMAEFSPEPDREADSQQTIAK